MEVVDVSQRSAPVKGPYSWDEYKELKPDATLPMLKRTTDGFF